MTALATPRWVPEEALIVLHDRSLALHGGLSGVRDRGLLESALERPKNRHAYEQLDDIAELAATYAAAISSNHPFADGNKRAAFAALTVFLELNGKRLVAPQAEAALTIFRLAAGRMTIEDLAAWIRANLSA